MDKNRTATHIISACYFSGKGEVELTWENIETLERAALTVQVTEEEGLAISRTIMACVYHGAINESGGTDNKGA